MDWHYLPHFQSVVPKDSIWTDWMDANYALVPFIKWHIFKCVVHLINILTRTYKNVEHVKVKLIKLVYYVVSKINIFHIVNLVLVVVTVIVTTQISTKHHTVVKVSLILHVNYQPLNQQFVVLNILLIIFVKYVQDIAQTLRLVQLGMCWNVKKFVNKTLSILVIWINVSVAIIPVQDVQLLLITVHVQTVLKAMWWSIEYVYVAE